MNLFNFYPRHTSFFCEECELSRDCTRVHILTDCAMYECNVCGNTFYLHMPDDEEDR